MEKFVARGQERFGILLRAVPRRMTTETAREWSSASATSRPTRASRGGFAPLPSNYGRSRPRLRSQLPDGQVFATITHGVRTMPAYAARRS